MTHAPALAVTDLEVVFDRFRALKGVSIAVQPGESFGLVGESGSGKSTLLRAVAGLAPVASGSIALDGKALGRRRDKAFYAKVQMVFQDPYGSLHPRQTVDRLLQEPLAVHGIGDGEQRIRRALEASLPDMLYDRLEGTTDSELFFLLMIDEGLDADPQGAVERAARRVAGAARNAGIEPSLKLTAAFSDGRSLYAVRHATEGQAPTLYSSALRNGRGRCIVSEPFDREGSDWQAVPPSSFVTIDAAGMSIRPFGMASEDLALAG